MKNRQRVPTFGSAGSLRLAFFAFAVSVIPACGGGGGGGGAPPPPLKWTVMVYMAADNDLEDFAPDNLNQMEAVAASPYLNVLVEVDTKTLPIQGSTTAKRLLIQPDADPNVVTSQVLADLGEIDTASPTALTSFVTWAAGAYTADRYILVMWDHGGQYDGYATDETTSPTAIITFTQLKTALANIETNTGIAAFDIIGFDACLMGAIETQRLVRDHANLLVGSAELEPGAGWDYTTFLNTIVANPATSSLAVAQAIAVGFLAQSAANGDNNVTLSVLDTAGNNAVLASVNSFATELQAALGLELATIAAARGTSTEYGRSNPSEPANYIEMRQFAAAMAANSSVASLRTAANAVVTAIDGSVLYRVQGALKPNHRGASIYFPKSAPDASYASVDVAIETQWDEFLNAYATAIAGDTTAPSITITGVSSFTVSPALPVTVGFDVTGSGLDGVTAEISTQITPTSWLILAEIDLDIATPGSYAVAWDSKVFILHDGTTANYLPAFVVDPSVNLHVCYVQYTPFGSVTPETLALYVTLDYAIGTGSIQGFFSFQASGAVSEVRVDPNDTVNVLLPVFDSTTGNITWNLSAASLTVPAGGLSIAEYALPTGNYDFDIFAKDYAGNIGVDWVTLTVP